MLGVRRASVTNTLHILEGKRLINSTRSQLEIRDREVWSKLPAGSTAFQRPNTPG
ncbi:hypothetical protein [Rhizobium sp. BK650]|uniref:hypothetical protein n=1 Tax=Rhizobium sp. BK650 TaxID=2586990 RepID=UPI001FEE60DB|nr:hypothetical protein [Rhizobium sp. BK650]